MFLALKKVGVRQYEDSDSKPGVGVSMQPWLPAGWSYIRTIWGHVPPWNFLIEKATRLLLISKSTLQALK